MILFLARRERQEGAGFGERERLFARKRDARKKKDGLAIRHAFLRHRDQRKEALVYDQFTAKQAALSID